MGACCTCLKRGGHVVKEHAKIATNAVVDVGNVLVNATVDATNVVSTAVADTVTDVTAVAIAPPIEGAKRALLMNIRPLVVRALIAMPFATGTLYAVKVGVVYATQQSSKTIWIAFVVQRVVPTVAMGVGCAILFVIRSATKSQA